MKKKFLTLNLILADPLRVKGKGIFLFLSFFAALVQTGPDARASIDVDRQYQLETIGYLKSWDNVDGLFADYVSTAYKSYFSEQNRFIPHDLTQVEQVLTRSKAIPYYKIIHDPDILAQIARIPHYSGELRVYTDSLIRTTIVKGGKKYTFSLEWIKLPQLEVLASTRFLLEEAASLSQDKITQSIHEALDILIKKVPYIGHVTGRDGASVTTNLGTHFKLKKGDQLTVGTLDEVRKHTLLKNIVDWRIKSTGRLEVEQVEDSMTFCKVLEEEKERPIGKYQKILSIVRAAEEPEIETEVEAEQKATENNEDYVPKVGWISGGLPFGSYSRQYSTSGGTVGNTGGGIALGGKVEGQLWLTSQWFSELELGFNYWGFGQKDILTGVDTAATSSGGVAGTEFLAKLDLGYIFLSSGDTFGSKGWAKFGYKSSAFSLPKSTSEGTGPFSIGSIFVGLGGSLPVREKWGIQANLDFRLLSFVSQTLTTDSVTSTADVGIFIGAYYRWSPRIVIRAGMDIQATGADFTLGSSLSQKVITFVPTFMYYF